MERARMCAGALISCGAVALLLFGPGGTIRAQCDPETSLPAQPYVWRNVTIGGGFVTGIITHPREQGLMYARTDVGGAYRWDDTAKRWIPITDWIGMADANLTGIESLALDPSDPNRVYLAAGTYSTGPAAILRSDDQGRTFQRSDVPFKMGGNEMGRFNGERLAVDPNQGEVLFFGSRRAGLWRSADRGRTWQQVESFPNVGSSQASPAAFVGAADSRSRFDFAQQPVGIVCVLFDPASGPPGRPTPTIYAAVSTTETNFYRSADAGVTWQAVANQPVGLRPNHVVVAPDGMLYLTCGQEPGPNTMTDGAVWKFRPKNGVWTDITPLKPAAAGQPFGYGAVAVDAQQPATIMVATFAHWRPHDEIFRSTNGGARWMPLLSKATWDHSRAPYTKGLSPHWMGDIEINPFDPDQALFTTGYGIWSCVNCMAADTGRATHWVFLNDGLEETVPLALISPPAGAHLLSGVGDIDGFRHDDLTSSPPQGAFAGPRFSNTEDMAVAGPRPEIIVRAGTGPNEPVRAAISRDGGKTWSALGSEPPNSRGAGTITISADGKIIVWTPRARDPHYTVDCGNKWLVCAGLAPGLRVVADPVNPARFYSYDPRGGRLLVSTNGACSFDKTEAVFPREAGLAAGVRFASSTALFLTPGREGDLWLAVRSAGLFHSTNGGTSFAKLGRVQSARSLGFGKAAPGGNFPALFLVGEIGGLQALFRSDDAGEDWGRINDARHQFGVINHVTGDPRIYGRVYLATGGRGVLYGDPAPNPQ